MSDSHYFVTREVVVALRKLELDCSFPGPCCTSVFLKHLTLVFLARKLPRENPSYGVALRRTIHRYQYQAQCSVSRRN